MSVFENVFAPAARSLDHGKLISRLYIYICTYGSKTLIQCFYPFVPAPRYVRPQMYRLTLCWLIPVLFRHVLAIQGLIGISAGCRWARPLDFSKPGWCCGLAWFDDVKHRKNWCLLHMAVTPLYRNAIFVWKLLKSIEKTRVLLTNPAYLHADLGSECHVSKFIDF